MLTDVEDKPGTSQPVAANSEKGEQIELLPDQNVDKNAMCKSLHEACTEGDLENVKLLLLKGANVDSRDSDQMTPLHKACQKDNHSIVEILLQSSANVEFKDENELTPLLIAAGNGHSSTIRVLLNHNANISARDKQGKTAILWAVTERKSDALQELLQHERSNDLIRETYKSDNTVLHVASRKGFSEIIEILLNHHADTAAKNRLKKTSLHVAAQNGHEKCILKLVEHRKESLHDEDRYCNTPLHLAAVEGHEQSVEFLLKAGANMEAKNILEQTPLHCAAERGWMKIVDVLISFGCAVNPLDEEHLTPLHLASKNGHVDSVELLLESQDNLKQKDKYNRNVLDVAIENGHRDVASAIIRHHNWTDVMRCKSIDTVTPLSKLIRFMPDVAEEVFDRCLNENAMPRDHQEYYITFNYELLGDVFISDNDIDVPLSEDERQSPQAGPDKTSDKKLNFNNSLYSMVKYKRGNLLRHPLVISLMNDIWGSYGRVAYYASFFLYLIFLGFFTGFMLVNPPPYFMLEITEKETVMWYENGAKRWEEGFSDITLFIFGKLGHWIIIILSCLSLFKEVAQLYIAKWDYFNWENLLEWCIYILAILVVLPLNNVTFGDGLVLRYDWQWQCGAFGIFFAWLNLILFIQKLSPLGIYVVIFTRVLKTFIKFSALFSLFVLAFAMTFYTLLMNQKPFRNLQYSFVKTFVMMIGEFEFDAIFHSQDVLTAMDLNNTSGEDFNTKLFYGGTTYTIFVVFTIIMSILLMNLLIGLTVEDIKTIHEKATYQRFGMMVKMMQFQIPFLIWNRTAVRNRTIYPNKDVPVRYEIWKKWFTWEKAEAADAIRAISTAKKS